VELALGLIVMTTIMMFGIHFAEMNYLGAKVHEAAAAAIWDSTAYETHQVIAGQPTAYDSARFAVSWANTSGARYADYDGRASRGQLGRSLRLGRTEADAVTTTCVQAEAYAVPAPTPFSETGGISCSATSELRVLHIAASVLDGSNGFFKAGQTRRRAYTVCSTGRLSGASCGSVNMLLGDYALHDASNEDGMCSVQSSGGAPGGGAANTGPVCGDNPHFYRAAQYMFDMTWGYTGIPENWANNIIPDVPRNQLTGFYMSFRGENAPSPFMESLPRGAGIWETSPYRVQLPAQGSPTPYFDAHQSRRNCSGSYCYLGKFNCD